MSDSVLAIEPEEKPTPSSGPPPPVPDPEIHIDEVRPHEPWGRIVERFARAFRVADRDTAVPVAIGLKAGSLVAQAEVGLVRLGAFLRVVGQALAKAGHDDALFWLQRRSSMGSGALEAVHGVVVDVDVRDADPVRVVIDNALKLPQLWFRTHNGCRLLYVFDGPAHPQLAEAFAARIVLGVPGADVESARLGHGQRLPVVRKHDAKAGLVVVDQHVTLVSSTPVAIDTWVPQLPLRFADAIHLRAHLSSTERGEVEEYLLRRGITVPADGTSEPFVNCPETRGHEEPCCRAHRRDGRITVVCYGVHGSTPGERAWVEQELLDCARAATANVAVDDSTFIRRAAPLTWAAERLVEQRLRELPGFGDASWRLARSILLVGAAVAHAREQATPDWPFSDALSSSVRVVRARLDGIDPEVGAVRPFFDRQRGAICLLSDDDTPQVLGLTNMVNFKRSEHVWHATTAMVAGRGGFEPHRLARARLALAEAGEPKALRALGIPLLRVEPFPVAFAETRFDIDTGVPGLVLGDVVPRLPHTDFDVIGFFCGLLRDGRLPLVDEGDVRRYLMMLAAPLVRKLVPGQQGIYLVTGPSGAGKEFLITLALDTHAAAVGGRHAPGFELSLDGDTERKRTFAAGAGKLFARLKEGGKRGRDKYVADLLIRLSGSADVAARHVHGSEFSVENGFVYVVDALEQLSSRVELARRTVTISASGVGDDTALGETRAAVLKHAREIVGALKQIVEGAPSTYYSQQPATDSRPVLQVALSRLLDADLAKVQGADLDEVWAAFAAYVSSHAVEENAHMASVYEGREKKDGPLPTLFPCARLTEFLSVMKKERAFVDALPFDDAQSLARHLMREARYDPRAAETFAVATVGTQEWVFRLFKENRLFVFVPRADYNKKMGIAAAAT